MLLAEDLLVLLVKSATTARLRHSETKPVLAAALLMELATAGRLGTDWDGGGRLHLFVDDQSPLGDPELDAALALVARMDGETLLDVVLALVPDLHVRLLNRLVARGWLAGRPFLGGWRVADQSRRGYLHAWLNGVLRGVIPVDWGSGALITLLGLANATSLLTSDPALVARASAIAAGDWPAGTAAAAIAGTCADIVRYWLTHGPAGFVGSPP
jgi:hypothetical protein